MKVQVRVNERGALCSCGKHGCLETEISVPALRARIAAAPERAAQIQAEAGVTTDGRFGPNTKRAVQAWQARHGLTADGLVGAATWAAMLTN